MYSISDLFHEYLYDKDLKESTQQSYNVACRAFIRRFGDCFVEEIDRKAVLQWRKDVLRKTLKEVSWNTYMRHLRGLYQFALKRGLVALTQNPFADCAVRCPQRPCKIISQEHMVRAREQLADMEQQETNTHTLSAYHPAWFWKTVYDTFAYSGIRANELLSLQQQDIDLKEKTIRITADVAKNHHERLVPIHDTLLPQLTRLVNASQDKKATATDQLFNVNVFSMRHKKLRMDMDQLSAVYKRLSKFLCTPVSPHRFRHTLATIMMQEDSRDIQTVKEILGHHNIATTMGYITVNVEQMRTLLNEVR